MNKYFTVSVCVNSVDWSLWRIKSTQLIVFSCCFIYPFEPCDQWIMSMIHALSAFYYCTRFSQWNPLLLHYVHDCIKFGKGYNENEKDQLFMQDTWWTTEVGWWPGAVRQLSDLNTEMAKISLDVINAHIKIRNLLLLPVVNQNVKYTHQY